LFNVVVGEMAVVGPRALLPEDQPRKFGIRLLVRPGITGWAQVNGGKLLTAEEKQPLDEWYVRNASLWLDLRILLATIGVIFFGERRSQLAMARNDANTADRETTSVSHNPAQRCGTGAADDATKA
jgi:lipopolysaccharide/colanic/teichoic acid biosynthesis glycosyltransferase